MAKWFVEYSITEYTPASGWTERVGDKFFNLAGGSLSIGDIEEIIHNIAEKEDVHIADVAIDNLAKINSN